MPSSNAKVVRPVERPILVGKRTPTEVEPHGEGRLLRFLLIFSAGFHALVILSGGVNWLVKQRTIFPEEAMDAELVADIDFAAPDKSALPKAAKADEAKVSERILPQLPKKFSIEQPQAKEDPAALEAPKEEPKKNEVVEVKREATPQKEPPKDEPKKETAKTEPKQKDLKIQETDRTDNKVKMEEALKRLAAERLRHEQKFSKQTEAPEEDKLARLAEEVGKRANLNAGAASANARRGAKKYLALIDQAVRRHYSLPEAYNLKGADISVHLAITVAENGSLMKLSVVQSSGDSVFDNLATEAVQASIPLPKPPADLAGERIILVFTPK